MKTPYILAPLLGVSLFCTSPLTKLAAAPAKSSAKKTPRQNIAGVDVSGLNAAQKSQRIARELKPKLDYKLKLTDEHRALYRRRRELGIRLDVPAMVRASQNGKNYVPLALSVQTLRLQIALRRLAPRFKATGRDARLNETKNGGVKIIGEQPSRALNVGASAVIGARAINRNSSTRIVKLASKTTPRKITEADFKGINSRIGTFTTDYNAGNVKRSLNMRIAIKAVDGTFVKPGKVFSLNRTVGERTQKRGYRTSIIFLNGYKVPGIGAGVSQVTGTLFNAALLAGLPIVEVRFHSQPVAYLPLGRDATVAWGGFDMKFKNNTKAPLYITYKVKGESVRATIFGAKLPKGRKVSISVKKQQKGLNEIHAQTYRTIRQGGKVVSKQVIRKHIYKWKKGKWEDG